MQSAGGWAMRPLLAALKSWGTPWQLSGGQNLSMPTRALSGSCFLCWTADACDLRAPEYLYPTCLSSADGIWNQPEDRRPFQLPLNTRGTYLIISACCTPLAVAMQCPCPLGDTERDLW